MNEISTINAGADTLPAMVNRAAKTLAGATSAAEILEAREMAGVAYDAAKRAARFATAKGAHDELLSKVHRAQADALEIEAGAKRRLADEYDAAQERGELSTPGGDRSKFSDEKLAPATQAVPPNELHEARMIRDAEEAHPGIVKATIEEAINAGEEPTRAKVRRAVLRTVKPEAPQRHVGAGKAAICRQVREAIWSLSGLPPAEEVLGYFAGTDEAVLVNERLSAAAAWLAAFADLWPEETNADSE